MFNKVHCVAHININLFTFYYQISIFVRNLKITQIDNISITLHELSGEKFHLH